MIISDPGIDPNHVVMVNFTSDDGDRSCVVRVGEHPFVTGTSFVYYGKARVVSLRELELSVRANLLRPRAPLSPTLLDRIRQSCRRTLPGDYVQILVDQGLI